ncbi:MAG: hypothetical protein HY350_00350 [Candidatus Omnitrophica bacterium]|nr:hypothetical protein [Candidatus Omnitrophota bacterium]
MILILLCMIIGFLAGLAYVMIKRKIRPGRVLTAAFLGLLSAGIWKVFKGYYQKKGRKRYF